MPYSGKFNSGLIAVGKFASGLIQPKSKPDMDNTAVKKGDAGELTDEQRRVVTGNLVSRPVESSVKFNILNNYYYIY